MPYFVYILRTSSNTLYIGQTNNLKKRIEEHKNKSSKSAKYIRYFCSFELVYHEKHVSRSEAMKRESQLKKLSRTEKEAIIAEDSELMKKLQKAADIYSPYNINVFNELFYKYARKELINELPNLFTKLELFNTALHRKITSEVGSNVITVMELASGKKMDRWETFMNVDLQGLHIPPSRSLCKQRKWRVLLTDFDNTLLPNLSTIKNVDNYKFVTDIYSLFNDLPKLKPDEKLDVMLSTYTFDNLWLENDFHLTKIDNVWYKNLYRLDLLKATECLKDIKEGKKLDRQFFKDLRIKTRKKKIDLSSVKYGVHIDEYYKNNKHVSVNYPGGLIDTVVGSFNNQLKREGIFITADIATASSSIKTKGYKSVNETIKIKIENYALAKYILEKLGFTVELKNLYEFIREARIVTPVKILDHFVLEVKLKESGLSE